MKILKKRFGDISPGAALILYYAVAIMAGATALSLPQASTGAPLSFLDALFTATSAQCVTGLIVVDTGSDLSLFGQLVVLVLIQVGGLGITTFSVYVFFYVNKRVGMRGRWIISETLLHTPVESLRGLIKEIVLLTLIIEAVGAVALAFVFVPEMGFARGIYSSVFHSISAFCNAGFSLFPDSMVRYRDDYLINFTIMALIVLGGIGFLVIKEGMDLIRQKEGRRRMSLHTKLVLVTTAVLIFGGFILIATLEYHLMYKEAGVEGWLLTSLFQSVTARTAGFNTVDLNMLEVPTLFLIMFLMFVGASPGSAGGGIKTTSLAIFIVVFYNRMKGVGSANVFRRTIPTDLAMKALALMMLAAIFVGGATFLLLAAQLPGLSFMESRGAFMDYAFEAVSAFGTVGLSLGATSKLTVTGKVIVILLMFIGRVGLLTVAYTIIERSRKDTARYSEENVMIG